jgi:hypothetical protein
MARSSLARRLALTAFVAAIAGLLPAAREVALAADPSPSSGPSASPSQPVCPDPFIAWFDQMLPPDVPVGRQIEIGITVWDCTQNGLAHADSAEIRVHPKTGKAAPAIFRSRSDWPGHLVATIEVPKGGLGAIEVGFRGQECHDDGTCKDAFFAFRSGGFGPPPDAPMSLLFDARIVPQPDPIVAGHTFDVDVHLQPKADWDPAALSVPDRIVISAQVVRGDAEWRSDARSVSGPSGPYTGQLTVDQPGDFVLRAGFPGNGAPDQMIDGSVTRITIEPADGGGATQAPAAGVGAGAATDTSSIPVLPIAAGVIGLLAVSLVIRRVFADL